MVDKGQQPGLWGKAAGHRAADLQLEGAKVQAVPRGGGNREDELLWEGPGQGSSYVGHSQLGRGWAKPSV